MTEVGALFYGLIATIISHHLTPARGMRLYDLRHSARTRRSRHIAQAPASEHREIIGGWRHQELTRTEL